MPKLTLLMVAVVGVGCSSQSSFSDAGPLKVKVAQSFRAEDLECFENGCGFERALMTGTTESFTLSSVGTTPLVNVRCVDASLCTVTTKVGTCCTGTALPCSTGTPDDAFTPWDACLAQEGQPMQAQSFTITALKAGDTTVEFTSVGTPGATVTVGEVVNVPVSVRDAARLEAQLPQDGNVGATFGPVFVSTSPVKLSGQHVIVRAIALDSANHRLWGSANVSMSVDTTIANFEGAESTSGWVGELWPVARGTTQLKLKAPSASTDVELISQ